MAKHRNSKIKPTSQQIIIFLTKNKMSIGEIVKLGYAESTVKYYRRKLFNPESYERFIKTIGEYNKARST
jgi:hypothetical protein